MNKIVDYTSSDESEENEEPLAKRKKLLPMPFEKNVKEVKNDPENHEGRKRQIEHLEGNWASHIFIDCSSLMENLKNYLNQIALINPEIKSIDFPHVSLSKTFILKYHWIDNFYKTLNNHLNFSTFFISFKLPNVKFLCNEDKSRYFACIQVNDFSNLNLKSIVTQIDKSLMEFNLPKYYKDSIFHASIFWKLTSFTEAEKENIISMLNNFEKVYDGECKIVVDKLIFKTGNKIKFINCK